MTRQPNRVLVVDDEPRNLELLEAMLTPLGYEVILADGGEKALQMVREGPPDVILLDIMMPAMDGYEVCRRLKADEGTREIPVIFVTAMTEVQDEVRGLDLGAVDYITKPISPPVVKARIKTHLALRNACQKLKQQNQILAENARLREDVERITRHDLKTPLSAVISVPGLLIKEGNLTSGQVELVQMLEESGYRMLEIINSSLDLYKMEQGTYRPNPVPVNVVSLVNQIRGEARELVGAKGLSVRVLVHDKPAEDSDVFLVHGEEMLLYSMLANLIKNAVEASPEGNQVTVSLTNGDSAVISIHNIGTVPDDVRDRFFEKYATSGKAGGTGLGTYSAKLIAETLGGRIGFDSTEKNGTTLTVVLPRKIDESPPETTPPKARPHTAALDKHLKVLV
ncbi:MAG: response regulator, partial [Proteobacteria bacterium]|nr:response regulator [Pseudomonadota bacterium]MBU1741939.1 response regulator [Pseudomonadota bacterium]